MTAALTAVRCAKLPLAELARLGPLRARDDVRVLPEGERLWVFWSSPDQELAAWLLALPGVELLQPHDDGWRALGGHLPIFDVPDPQSMRKLHALLFPAPITPIAPGASTWRPIEVRLVPDEAVRKTTALLVLLVDLVRWADGATSHALARLVAARCDDRVLLRGSLPPLLGERYWGERVLVPAGWRYEPAVAESVLAQALHLDGGDVVLLSAAIRRPSLIFLSKEETTRERGKSGDESPHSRERSLECGDSSPLSALSRWAPRAESLSVTYSATSDVIPASAFAPVTRAGLRLAVEAPTHAR